MTRPVILATCVAGMIATKAWTAQIWDNGGGNTSWGTAANWNPDGVPASGADVTFGTAGSEATLDMNRIVGQLTFNAASDFTVDRPAGSDYTLTINSGITVALPGRVNRSYSISAPILLGGDNVWNLGNNFQGSNTGNVSISGGIGETGGSHSLTKTGISTLILSAAGTYTGATIINNGIFNLANNTATLAASDLTLNGGTSAALTINNNATADDTPVVRAKSLTLNGGEFKVTGVAGFRSTDVITGAITIGAGPSIITADANNRRTVIQADSLARTSNAGYTIFRGDGLGASAANSGGTATTSNIMFTNAPSASLFTGAGGAAGGKQISILAWAVGDSSATGLGSGFVTYDTARGIRLLDNTTEYAATASGAATNDNVRVAANDSFTGSKTINALLVTGPGTTTALTLGSGANLAVASGALLITGTSNVSIGGAGTLDFGSSDVAFLTAVGTSGTKQITANILGAGTTYKFGDANLTISGSIGDGTGGPTNLVVGQGTLTLSGVNTYTGTTTIQRGRITVAADAPEGAPGALGNSTSAVILGNASSTESEGISIYLNPGVTFGRDVIAALPQIGNPDSQRYRIGVETGSATVAPTSTVTIGATAGGRRLELVAVAASSALDFQGNIVNTASVPSVLINGSNAGTGTVRLSNPNSSYNSGTTIVNGTLVLGASVASSGNSPIGTGGLVFYEGATPAAGATLGLLLDGSWTFARTVTLGGSSTAGNYTAIIGGSGANSSALFSGSISSSADVKTKNIQAFAGTSTTTVTFSGQVTANTDATGVTNLEKTGAGTVVLSNANNTYDGTTLVTAGTLLVNGALSTSAAGVTVNAGGTLGGIGTVNRTVTVNANGVIAPGSTVTGVDYAQLDTGSLVLAANSLFSVDIGSVSLFDQLNVTGTVSLAGDLQVKLLNGFDASGSNTFFLLLNDGTDAIAGTFTGLPQGSDVVLNGRDFTISYMANGDGGSIGNDVALVASVPEPSAMLSLLGGAGLIAARRRRRVR
ncbi:MAG TPA: autotransporter-associated beta strand repeat-containing protein [Chthoniobacter sp.]|nr:autotransporter-associated beta strand repeat-containing protein [Chthoniobacter sp.]